MELSKRLVRLGTDWCIYTHTYASFLPGGGDLNKTTRNAALFPFGIPLPHPPQASYTPPSKPQQTQPGRRRPPRPPAFPPHRVGACGQRGRGGAGGPCGRARRGEAPGASSRRGRSRAIADPSGASRGEAGGTWSGWALLRCMLRAGLLGRTLPQPGTVQRMLVLTWDSSVTEGRTSSPAGGRSPTGTAAGAGGRPKPPPRRPAAAAAMLLSAAQEPPPHFRGRPPIVTAADEYSRRGVARPPGAAAARGAGSDFTAKRGKTVQAVRGGRARDAVPEPASTSRTLWGKRGLRPPPHRLCRVDSPV